VLCGGEVVDGNILSVRQEQLWQLYTLEGEYPQIPVKFGDRLRELFPLHEKTIKGLIEKIKVERKTDLDKKLQKKAEEEAVKIRELMQERLNEIDTRKNKLEEEKGRIQLTLDDFTDEEKEQWSDDISRLDTKYKQLKAEIEKEPDRARMRYKLKNFDIYPIATLYVIPKSLVSGWANA
jgi:DNA repair exonuclease SbcCD ATPase subunit